MRLTMSRGRGIPVVAIGTGTSAMAKEFKKQYDFIGRMYVDQRRAIYKMLSCKRGVGYLLHPQAILAIREAAKEFSQGAVQGDG